MQRSARLEESQRVLRQCPSCGATAGTDQGLQGAAPGHLPRSWAGLCAAQVLVSWDLVATRLRWCQLAQPVCSRHDNYQAYTMVISKLSTPTVVRGAETVCTFQSLAAACSAKAGPHIKAVGHIPDIHLRSELVPGQHMLCSVNGQAQKASILHTMRSGRECSRLTF